MSFNGVADSLKCPITQELLEDPIVLPCCNNAISRQPMIDWYSNNSVCPLCRTDLFEIGFDPSTASVNHTLANLISSFLSESENVNVNVNVHKWDATLETINDDVSMLTLSVSNSKFVTSESMFIAVVDNSGSMSGNPINQVKSALKHICGIITDISKKLIVYSSTASTMDFTQSNIDSLSGTGGTNFINAFAEIEHILRTNLTCKRYTIVFMTDGEDASGVSRPELLQKFNNSINGCLINNIENITVHTIGFGGSCDRNLLESMLESGTESGTFRYAEPNEKDDSLCQKIMGVFSLSSNMMSIPVTVKLPMNMSFFQNIKSKNSEIKVILDSKRWGRATAFIKNEISDPIENTHRNIEIQSPVDDNILVPLIVCPAKDDTIKKFSSHLIDIVAGKILSLSKEHVHNDYRRIVSVFYTKYLSQLNELSSIDSDRIVFLTNQLKVLASGGKIDDARVSDMRFSSLFSNTIVAKIPITNGNGNKIGNMNVPLYRENVLEYNVYTFGTPLIESISSGNKTFISSAEIQSLLDKTDNPRNAILQTNSRQVNALMALASAGHYEAIEYVLKYLTSEDVNKADEFGETALTLAVKKRGYDKTLKLLINSGAKIPHGRRTSILRWAYDNNYCRTVKILNTIPDEDDAVYEVSDDMSPEFIREQFAKAKAKGFKSVQEISNANQFFTLALAKLMPDIVTELINTEAEVKIKIVIDHVLNYTIPPKPDHPDVAQYLSMTDILISKYPHLLTEVNADGETVLHVSARKGSLDHVQYFLKKGVLVDVGNNKGTTALGVACTMQYPCIITELINAGANIEWESEKGTTPLYNICMRGSRKVAELLISYGAKVDHITKCGNDTPILTCCRHGHDEILSLLLDYVSKDFVNHIAPIDGFNAVMACAEAGHKPNSMTGKTCLQILHQYGIDLNQQTSLDNKIYSGATPLHIASYYGRTYAIEDLLNLGCDVNSKDCRGSTPLHIAVIQGYVQAVQLLLKQGADVTIADNEGQIPADYCQLTDNKELRDCLIDPVSDVINDIIESNDETYVSMALSVIDTCASQLYWPCKINNRSDLLTKAVILSKYDIVKTLIDITPHPTSDKIPLLFWALNNKHVRMIELLKQKMSDEKNEKNEAQRCVNLINDVVKNKRLLFLGRNPYSAINKIESSLLKRMRFTFQNISDESTTRMTHSQKIKMGSLQLPLTGQLSSISDSRYMLDAKVQMMKSILLNKINITPDEMSPEMLLSIILYTNNDMLHSVMNKETHNLLYTMLNGSLSLMPKYTGEVFQGFSGLTGLTSIDKLDGINDDGHKIIDRKLLKIGNIVSTNDFTCGSTSWRLATQNCPSFTTKSRQGTILLFKSKTGRLISHVSQYPTDSEVIFLPETCFKVTNWYHGNVIALGQENIRSYSYQVKETDTEMMSMNDLLQSNKSLIIELTEC